MGCNYSKEEESQSNFIRVVHVNGYVEDFYYPLTAGEVTGTPPKRFLCTQSQLMAGHMKPLKPDVRLEPSHVYFMLSYSTIQSESSPMDIATMAKRLVKLAKTSSSNGDSPRGGGTGCELPGQSSVADFGKNKPSKVSGTSWKPILATIREGSFHCRSESDLGEMHLEIMM